MLVILFLISSYLNGALAAVSTVYLVDGTSQYLNALNNQEKISSQFLLALESQVLGIQSPVSIDQDISDKISLYLKPAVFSKPDVLLSISIAGLSKDDLSQQQIQTLVANGKQLVELQVTDTDLGKDALVYSGLMTAEHLTLLNLQECSQVCLQNNLQTLANAFSVHYLPQEKPLSGSLVFNAGQHTVVLRLSNPAVNQWAMQLANAYYAVGQLEPLETSLTSTKVPMLVDGRIIGLQRLKKDLSGAEWAAAVDFTVLVVQKIVALVDRKYGNSIKEVSLLGDIPEADLQMEELEWPAKRRLQEENATSVEEEGDEKEFTSSSVAYIAFLLLVYFVFAAMYCMCNMKFKQDSLLYGRPKAD